MTGSQLSAAIDKAIAKYGNNPNGKKVGYKGLYVGECLSLEKSIRQDIHGVDMPASGTGYGDGYYENYDKLPVLKKYYTKEPYVNGRNYPKGTIIVYKATHHIATFLQDNGNFTHNVYEQNADPDGSAPHIGTRSNGRATGVLVPRLQAEPTNTAKAPVVDKNSVGKTVFLKPHVAEWRIYPTNKEPVKANALSSKLKPSKFGGLSYRIEAVTKYPQVVTIQTRDFGKVNIYVDADAEIR